MKHIRDFHLIFFFQFLEVKFTIYLNRRVFVMILKQIRSRKLARKTSDFYKQNKQWHDTTVQLKYSQYTNKEEFNRGTVSERPTELKLVLLDWNLALDSKVAQSYKYMFGLWRAFTTLVIYTSRIQMSNLMTNQQNGIRLRSAWASAKSDQSSLSHGESLGPKLTKWHVRPA